MCGKGFLEVRKSEKLRHYYDIIVLSLRSGVIDVNENFQSVLKNNGLKE